MAKVSICIPAYKDVNGIGRLMDSIARTEYSDAEVIITDDTPDGSVSDIVRGYLTGGLVDTTDGFTGDMSCDRGRFSLNVSYHHNDKALGPAGNWNRAMDLAEGEYIKIMHQDDWFTAPDSLGRFVSMLDSDSDAVLAYSGSRQVTIHPDDPGRLDDYFDRCISDENRALIENDWRALYIGQYIGAPSAVIHRRSEHRFDPNLKWLIDADFYMKLLRDGARMVSCRDPLVCIGVSDTQMTNECIDSREVNLFEYKYVYNTFGLGEYQAYRNRLADVCVRYKGRYSDIAGCGISKAEYREVHSAYIRELAVFYRDLIIRKLFHGKDKKS